MSYTAADAAWAEWAAYVLEDAGFATVLQAWDFRPGSNFVLDTHDALRRSDRVLLVLSEAYLRFAFAVPAWTEPIAADPRNSDGRPLPVRVGDCEPSGRLRTVVYVDLVGVGEAEAKRRLLAGVARGRAKPSFPPGSPGSRPPSVAPRRPFPGTRPADENGLPASTPRATARRTPLVATIGALATALLVAIAVTSGVGPFGPSPRPTTTHATPPSSVTPPPPGGTVQDDFSDPSSGWTVASDAFYRAGGYRIRVARDHTIMAIGPPLDVG